MTIKIFNGIPVTIPNKITTETTDYYISYNNRDIGIYGCDTTALVLTKPDTPEKFLILNGNHVNAYEIIKDNKETVKDCIQYFKNNYNQQSKYSENWDEMFVFGADGRLTIAKDPSCQ